MKFRFLVDDIANVLTEYYIHYRQIQVSERKLLIMRHHMKQTLLEEYAILYGTFEEIYSISVLDTPNYNEHILGYETDYDRKTITEIMDHILNMLLTFIQERKHTIDDNDDVISINVSPFDSFLIVHGDIIHLLDLDCL